MIKKDSIVNKMRGGSSKSPKRASRDVIESECEGRSKECVRIDLNSQGVHMREWSQDGTSVILVNNPLCPASGVPG